MTTINPRRERGVTMVIAMLIILALMALGASTAYFSSIYTGAARNLKSRQVAMNAAQSGIQHARQVLAVIANAPGSYCSGNIANPWSCVIAGRSYHSATARDDLQSTTNINGQGAVMFDGSTAIDMLPYPNDGGPVLGYYIVYARNDPNEINSAVKSVAPVPNAAILIDTNHTIVLRAYGYDMADQSGAQVVVESATTQVASTVTTNSADNFVYGKDIDPYGTNSTTGAVTF